MTISVTCSNCGAAYEMPDDLGGQIGQCACGATFQIPHQPAAVAIPVETPDSSDNPFSAPTAEIIATTGSPVQHGLSTLEVTQITKCKTGLSLLFASVIILIIAFFGVLMLGLSGTAQPRETAGTETLFGLMALAAFVFSVIGNGFLMSAPSRCTGQGLLKAAFGLQLGAVVLSLFGNFELLEQLSSRVRLARTDQLSLTLVVLGMQLAYNICWCLGMQRFFGFLNDPINAGRASLFLKLMVTVIGLAILTPIMLMTIPMLAVVSGVSIFVIGIVTIIVYVRLIEQGRKTLRNITG